MQGSASAYAGKFGNNMQNWIIARNNFPILRPSRTQRFSILGQSTKQSTHHDDTTWQKTCK